MRWVGVGVGVGVGVAVEPALAVLAGDSGAALVAEQPARRTIPRREYARDAEIAP